MSKPQIILNNVSFQLPNTPVVFTDLTLVFESLRYGIVGDNGVGKTTFLKLLSGELTPDKGSIQHMGAFCIVPQSHAIFPDDATVGEVLGVSEILLALSRINSGQSNDDDFETVNDHWDIDSRIDQAFKQFNLDIKNISTPFMHLSGGQKTKVLLIKTQLFLNHFMLLDEPTNNLDKASRDLLTQQIEAHSNGLIVVSHDRDLLNKMDHIIEITPKGIHCYGGNYDFYQQQKAIELDALQHDYMEAKRQITKAKRSVQSTREKHEQRRAKGMRARRSGSQDKITLNSMKGRSEKTQSKMAVKEDHMLSHAKNKLDEVKDKIEIKPEMQCSLDATRVPNGKIVLEIENLSFSYPDQTKTLIQGFNLTLTGPQRIAIVGPNGCGKSTLIKLIRSLLKPIAGKIKVGVDQIAYLDQDVSYLDRNLTLIDNFIALNPEATIFDAHSALAAFNFRNTDAQKQVSSLSGGERMRAGLAIAMMSKHPPQLIILDEPTNHLDLNAILAIEKLLNLYNGAILAVSHDAQFLENINIDRYCHTSN